MKVDRLDNVLRGIDETLRQAKASARTVVVGFTQRYAIKVHEEDMRHAEGKSNKYLEIPSRRLNNNGTVGKIIYQVFRRTGDLQQAMIDAGFRILRDAQEIVPVDTSALRASGYVCLESQHNQVASAKFAESEALRQKKEAEKFAKYEKKMAAKRKKKEASHRKRHRSWDKRRKAWEKKHGWNG